MSGFALLKEKTTSKAITKKYAKVESPGLFPLSNLSTVLFYHH